MHGCIDACICLRLQKVMLELHMSDAIQYLELCFVDLKTQPGRRPVFYYEMALDICVRTEFCFLTHLSTLPPDLGVNYQKPILDVAWSDV